jgi:hypothetical protein
MTDKREDILVALGAALTGVLTTAGFAVENFLRDAQEVPEDLRPAIVMLDADETVDEALNPYGKGRPTSKTIPLAMSPETFVLLQETDDLIGPKLNEWRAMVIKAVMTDTTLNSLCHEIRYEGFTSALANGRSMEGQAKLHFTFIYMLRPDQL